MINTKLAEYWVEKLVEAFKESLAESGQNDHMVKVFSLYNKLEPQVIQARSERSNIRAITKDHENLTHLCKLLRDRIDELEAEGDFTLPGDLKEHSLGAILAVAFSGIVAAKLDSNFQDMKVVCDWCDRALGTGKKTKDYSIILAAEYYHMFGSYRREVSQDIQDIKLPTENELKSLLDQAEEECESAKSEDKNRYIRRLRLFLMEAITQLPPYRQSELGRYPDLLNLDRLQGAIGPIPARTYYSLSKVLYAQSGEESLDKAIEYAVDSLQYAKPADVGFIEQCRQNLLILEQEKAARSIIKSESVKDSVAEAKDQLGGMLKAAQSEFEDKIGKDVSTFQEKVRRDIKDSLLRVIEILGIFLAVAGVIVTEVGGLTAGNSIGHTLIIYGVGNATILILFLFLRVFVLGDLRGNLRDTLRDALGRSQRPAQTSQTVEASSSRVEAASEL